MSVKIPDTHKDLLAPTILSTVTTVSEDGEPQSTVLWRAYDGEAIRISTLATRQKTKNIESNPKVSVMTVDPQNPYRYLELRGTVEDISRENVVEFVNQLAKTYTGKDKFYGDVAPAELEGKEDRVTITIIPEHVVTYG